MDDPVFVIFNGDCPFAGRDDEVMAVFLEGHLASVQVHDDSLVARYGVARVRLNRTIGTGPVKGTALGPDTSRLTGPRFDTAASRLPGASRLAASDIAGPDLGSQLVSVDDPVPVDVGIVDVGILEPVEFLEGDSAVVRDGDLGPIDDAVPVGIGGIGVRAD